MLVMYNILITKQARVLKENGAVSPIEIHSDQFKLGIRTVSIFVCQIYCGKKKL